MKNLVFKTAFLALLFSAFLTQNACEKPVDPDEQETINGVKISVALSGFPNEKRDFFWTDLDGDGGVAPVIDTVRLIGFANQFASVAFFSKTGVDSTDITAEVRAENAAHLVVWQSSSSKMTVGTSDLDANGAPLGLDGFFSPTEKGVFTVTIRLLHEPNKSNLAAPGGETDVEVTFPVVVE